MALFFQRYPLLGQLVASCELVSVAPHPDTWRLENNYLLRLQPLASFF